MTYARLNSLLSRLSYKPGHSFVPLRNTGGSSSIVQYERVQSPAADAVVDAVGVEMPYVDVRRPERSFFGAVIPIHRFNDEADDAEIAAVILKHLVYAESHEAQEQFRLDGALVQDPHSTGEIVPNPMRM